ncbi:hypothetical protein MUU72_24270 [Streptomyces sp. RS10V-4]|uniref:hypothetical protein n=1 Tax=Streptomyces rhizoryzae TaxID=2932493 RepID=UPI002002D3FD|nr:hypothetical protein [Streptomyces rhizoryzae]MCK7626183.1 hypothetical protein [Streptomyces rhizoryzae]
MLDHLEPDVAFGVHPVLGIAAATADDRPFLDEVLRRHHFRYSEDLDVYLLPAGTPPAVGVRAVAHACRALHDAGLTAAADPRILSSRPDPDDLSANRPARSRAATASSAQRPTATPTPQVEAPPTRTAPTTTPSRKR